MIESSWFAVVPPGLEGAASEEIAAFGVPARADHGGVVFGGGITALWRVHLHARLPVRVWARVGRARGVRSLDALAHAVRSWSWTGYVWPRQPVAVQVALHGARWARKDAVARKTEVAIRDALRVPRKEGRRPPHEPVEILVRVDGDTVEVSVDATGERLHRRGWRRDASDAPLRENLAAAVLWLAEWEPGEPLVDPMCGSGTFPIEAATIAQRLAPGRARSFAFERWPSFEPSSYAALRDEPLEPPIPTAILGADRDPRVIEAARANARRAGVASVIDLRCAEVGELVLPAVPGLIVANPPYGERIRGAEAAWTALGQRLRRAHGWRSAVLSPDPRWVARCGLDPRPVATFSHGGIRVGLYTGRIDAEQP